MNKIPRGIKAERAYGYIDLELEGQSLRRQIGLSPHERIDALRLYDEIQEQPLVVSGKSYPVGCRVGYLDDGLEAQAQFLSDRQEYEVVLTPETYGWLEVGNPRGTWGLLHEVDHVRLHPILLQKLAALSPISRAALYRGQPKMHRFCEDTEWQADALTGAALMPAAGIWRIEVEIGRDHRMLVQRIMTQYGVSREAATNRLYTYRKHQADLLSAGV
jgi:hypothetical protein